MKPLYFFVASRKIPHIERLQAASLRFGGAGGIKETIGREDAALASASNGKALQSVFGWFRFKAVYNQHRDFCLIGLHLQPKLVEDRGVDGLRRAAGSAHTVD